MYEKALLPFAWKSTIFPNLVHIFSIPNTRINIQGTVNLAINCTKPILAALQKFMNANHLLNYPSKNDMITK